MVIHCLFPPLIFGMDTKKLKRIIVLEWRVWKQCGMGYTKWDCWGRMKQWHEETKRQTNDEQPKRKKKGETREN